MTSDESGRSRMKVDPLAQTLWDTNECGQQKAPKNSCFPKVGGPENHNFNLKNDRFRLKILF